MTEREIESGEPWARYWSDAVARIDVHALGPETARIAARAILRQHTGSTRICDVYGDEAVAFALPVIHPQFEYGPQAQQTLAQFLQTYDFAEAVAPTEPTSPDAPAG